MHLIYLEDYLYFVQTGKPHYNHVPLGAVRPIYRTATPLPSKHPILYIFSTIIRTKFFKHAAHCVVFSPLQNSGYFIMLPFLVSVLFAF
jgi:hypothetical protein